MYISLKDRVNGGRKVPETNILEFSVLKKRLEVRLINISSQILISRIVRLPLSGEAVHPRVPPRLWRSSRSMPGSPRSESPIVDGLHSLQRNASSLRNIWQRLNIGAVPFPELLGVGGSLRLSSFVCSELGVISLEHLLVTSFNLLESPTFLTGDA